MPTRRGDRWQGRLKIQGQQVQTKMFSTKKAALEWERRLRGSYEDFGHNPADGKMTVAEAFEMWLEMRANDETISESTRKLDEHLYGYLPLWFRKMSVGAINEMHIVKWMQELKASKTGRPLAPTSKKRLRATLSAFFSWRVHENYIRHNPVLATKAPKDMRAKEGIRPFTEQELNRVVAAVAKSDPRMADIVKIMGWTGLRWGEVRAITVGDFERTPIPVLRVSKNHPEHASLKSTKSGKPRIVGVTDEVLPLLESFAAGRSKDQLLFTTAEGGQLWRSNFVRKVDWKTVGKGRTLHDLRHTAACLWLINHVPLGTVQAWLGHSTIQMTSRYLHHIGDVADRAALELLNSRNQAVSE